jgi:hypothetical protein
MFARILREQYTELHQVDTPTIKICAYDPNYTHEDLVVLEKFSPPISVVSSPYHFLAVNEHTLVLCAYCPTFVPNFEVIADMMYPSGPAAIFTNEIWDDMPWFAEQKLHLLDVCAPNVDQMLKQYTKAKFEDSYWNTFDPAKREPWYWLNDMALYVRNGVIPKKTAGVRSVTKTSSKD